MNFNESSNLASMQPEKKRSRKEKKKMKKEQKSETSSESSTPSGGAPAPDKKEKAESASITDSLEEVEASLEPVQPKPVPPPKYTLWEKISPAARRKRQLATMESGYREVLGLVQAMRANQDQLLESFKKLPEAVDSVKRLADHSATQSEILKSMNETIGGGGKFNETLASMDRTTQQLLERAQRSEERLYGMLRRAQRRIAFMTLLVLLLFIGAMAAVVAVINPEGSQNWLQNSGLFATAPAEAEEVIAPESETGPATEAEAEAIPEIPDEVLEEVQEIDPAEAVPDEPDGEPEALEESPAEEPAIEEEEDAVDPEQAEEEEPVEQEDQEPEEDAEEDDTSEDEE